jgi:hypothetical protein
LDGIFWYTFEPKLAPERMPFVADPYDISHDPVKMAQLASGALLFLRGDVITGRVVLQNLAPAMEVQVTPLDGAGRALGQSIPAAKTGAGWAIALGKPATTWYEVTVRRASLR